MCPRLCLETGSCLRLPQSLGRSVRQAGGACTCTRQLAAARGADDLTAKLPPVEHRVLEPPPEPQLSKGVSFHGDTASSLHGNLKSQHPR